VKDDVPQKRKSIKVKSNHTPNRKVSVSWIITTVLLTFFLSVTITVVTSSLLDSVPVTVALLILPYLLMDNSQYMTALFTMIAVVILIIAGFTYYISVAKGEKFKPRFLEMTFISVGVAVVSFFVGVLAKQFLGVDL